MATGLPIIIYVASLLGLAAASGFNYVNPLIGTVNGGKCLGLRSL